MTININIPDEYMEYIGLYIGCYLLLSLPFIALFIFKRFYRTGRNIRDSNEFRFLRNKILKGLAFPFYLKKELKSKPEYGQICISCHFLIGRQTEDDGSEDVSPLNFSYRNLIKDLNSNTFIDNSIVVECYKKATNFLGFTNSGHFPSEQKCSFWVREKEKMDLSTMEELQKRELTKWTNIRSWLAIVMATLTGLATFYLAIK